MFKNYLVVAWRSFIKRKTLNVINIIGISFGVAFSLLTLLFIQDEYSFDNFHINKDFIYRVDHYNIRNSTPDPKSRSVEFPLPFASTLLENVSGIKHATRYDSRTNYIRIDKNQFRESIHYVDRDFIKMFTINFVQGNSEISLKKVSDILISDSKASKLFGTTNILGRRIEIDDKPFVVSGVFKNLPRNSSLHCEILVPYDNFPPNKNQHDDWSAWYSPVFIQLNSLIQPDSLASQLRNFSKNHFTISQSNDQQIGLSLMPLGKIHFDSQVPWFNVSDIKYSYILGGISLTVILVACINYILLSLAGSMSRTREIGIRKVIGATKKMIQSQFISESLIVIAMSLPVSLLIVQLILPEFNSFMGKEFALLQLINNNSLTFLLLIVIITGLFAGGYPAFVLSNLEPEKILKGNNAGSYKTKFSGFLIVLQFTTCFVLLICAHVMFNQMKMIQAKDLGFNQNQIVIVDAANNLGINGKSILNTFRSELANESDILEISAIQSDFGIIPGSSSHQDAKGNVTSEYYCTVDYDFFEMLEIKLIDGRFFSRNFPTDTLRKYVINERLANQIENGPLVGSQLPFSRNSEIIGIVKDFNFQSLNYDVKPMAFSIGKYYGKILLKIQPNNIPKTIAKIESCWKKTVGDGQMQYSFLDDQINKQYDQYTQWIRIISISAFSAIAISSLGLLGIISLVVFNRTKEIGIRKIFGASIASILGLFTKYYIKLIFLSFILAAPMAYNFCIIWLQDFAYKTEIVLWNYAVPLIAIVGLSIIVIGTQIIKTAKANPVDSIRCE